MQPLFCSGPEHRLGSADGRFEVAWLESPSFGEMSRTFRKQLITAVAFNATSYGTPWYPKQLKSKLERHCVLPLNTFLV